jgi:hypothetical protein
MNLFKNGSCNKKKYFFCTNFVQTWKLSELKKLRYLVFIGSGTKLKMCESMGRGPKGQTVKSGLLKDSLHLLTHTQSLPMYNFFQGFQSIVRARNDYFLNLTRFKWQSEAAFFSTKNDGHWRTIYTPIKPTTDTKGSLVGCLTRYHCSSTYLCDVQAFLRAVEE